MSDKIKIGLQEGICFLLNYYLLIDMINGVLLRNGFYSISSIYKIFLLGFIFIFLRKEKKLYIPFLFLCFYFVFHLMIVENIGFTLDGLNWLFKFFFIYWVYLFFQKQLKVGNFGRIITFMKASSFFIILNSLLGVVGLGYAKYGENIGMQGLIYAGNELSIGIVCCFSFLLQFYLVRNQYKKYLLFAAIFLFISLLTTMKVPIFSAFIILFIFPILKASDRLYDLKLDKRSAALTFFTTGIIPIVGFIGIYYVLFELGLWNRIHYFYYTKGFDLITVIFSNRNLWAHEAIEGFAENYNFFEKIFGSGKSWITFLSTPGKGSVEIDIIDFLMFYGMIGVFITYGFLFLVLIKTYKSRKKNPFSKYLIVIIFFIVLISITAGHVLYSGIGGPLIAGVLAISNYTNGKLIIDQ